MSPHFHLSFLLYLLISSVISQLFKRRSVSQSQVVLFEASEGRNEKKKKTQELSEAGLVSRLLLQMMLLYLLLSLHFNLKTQETQETKKVKHF